MTTTYSIIEVREFSNELYASLSALMPQLDDTVSFSEDDLRNIIDSPSSTLFIATDSNSTAGMLTLGYYPALSGNKAWIEDVVVDSNHRGYGLGKMLVQHAIDHARTLGADMVMLTSNPKREAANLLYQKLGFAIKHTNLYSMPLK